MSLAGRRSREAIVSGGGPAALVAATALALRGWKVRLKRRAERPARVFRADLLNGSALPALARIGLSRDDLAAISQPCPGILCRWDADHPYGQDFLGEAWGDAWAVDRPEFDRLLLVNAIKAGVALAANEEPGADPADEDQCDAWRILATGRMAAPSRTGKDGHDVDDRLIAIVGRGQISASAFPLDRRLLIEAGPDGWAYALPAPGGRVCVGTVTDALALRNSSCSELAFSHLKQTVEIAALLKRLDDPPQFQSTPVPCFWLPIRSGARTLRIGDAQCSLDPLSGRGLWEAVCTSLQVATLLSENPFSLAELQLQSLKKYIRYQNDRRSFYESGSRRFQTDFWARRESFFLSRDTESRVSQRP